ncbi:ABC transporter ATP-binding protein [Pontibacillus litoralis]|uniref:Peptide ABC transporter substrate-binding protein n=1 Tax=Pontibacillus litoralis JSM 072002 TaxID=1385512 RepID=A0A0A5G3K9_9BACI|nr:oligopeptide/dipeptide ABC transporter ATP-binding protein [Pontibacillus litoralis]KGX86619.1 peptide ABC transporter substrate-binding protein [Pontibacillus litoralis JSM 072002]
MAEPLIEISNLKKDYPIPSKKLMEKKWIHAVDDINLIVNRGESVGIVGESGCGKSTTGQMIAGLLSPTSGSIQYHDKNGSTMNVMNKTKQYHRNVQMIFQDPYASLNPRHRISKILEEPLRIHKIGNKSNRKKKIEDILQLVGFTPDIANRFPHELSGGQRQRIGIARALMLNPTLVIADEPVSALDVSVQSQILNLMKDLQQSFDLTYIFISHDLHVVHYFCDKVAVMYFGKIVEMGNVDELFYHPTHPYTKALLSVIPTIGKQKERIILQGEVPNPESPPTGCTFHTRCPLATDLCRTAQPTLQTIRENHVSACHFAMKGEE